MMKQIAENFTLSIEWFERLFLFMHEWSVTHIFSVDGSIQFGAVIVSIVLGVVLAKRLRVWADKPLRKASRYGGLTLHLSYYKILLLVLAPLFLWTSYALVETFDRPSSIIFTICNLASVWAVIRLTASTIKSTFWGGTIAIILWAAVALNIIGYLNEFISAMDSAAMTIGEFRLSLLLVLKAFLAFVVLLWVIRIISGVLKRAFFRANITPSQRVLFFKLSNISLYALGAVVGLNIIGIDLTTLAVFSGALGLGIGFGLQKVFSNLISGIILLLDKSVKPGDVVAIDGTYGWVNSLGARCVSVLTRDGKEHLIPNENLITQEVENWSYSDQKVRVHIEIGVSYNSDIHLVKELLLKSVDDHDRVLKDPKPVCLIVGFGDSSIDHDLRVWIADPEKGVANVKSQIYYRIWELFKENNIEIPFPQRDIHIIDDVKQQSYGDSQTKSKKPEEIKKQEQEETLEGNVDYQPKVKKED